MTFCNGLRFFLAALARRENIRECLTSVTPSVGGSRVDKDLLVVLTCRDGLLVGVSGVATTSPAGVLKAGRAWVRVRVRVKGILPLLKNVFFELVGAYRGAWEFGDHPRIGLGPADLLKKCGAPVKVFAKSSIGITSLY